MVPELFLKIIHCNLLQPLFVYLCCINISYSSQYLNTPRAPLAEKPVDAGDDDQDEDAQEDDVHHVDFVGVEVDCLVTQPPAGLLAGAGVRAEHLAVTAGVCVPADTLAVLPVPRVGRAVEAGELVPGQVGETVTGAGVCQELLPGAAGVGAQGTLAPAGAAVVLQLDGGAVGRAVHVDHHRVTFQLGLLRGTAGAQTVQTET